MLAAVERGAARGLIVIRDISDDTVDRMLQGDEVEAAKAVRDFLTERESVCVSLP